MDIPHKSDARRLDAFPAEVAETTKGLTELVHQVGNSYSLAAHQAEWYVRGIAYHCLNLYNKYSEFIKEVIKRVGASAEEAPFEIVMYAPACQPMMFEFYALLNLSRIALDHLRTLLAPKFKTPLSQLPKSVKDYVNSTDCPLYIWLSGQPILAYLLDLRDCIVHYRTFATSDNALVLRQDCQNAEQMRVDWPEVFKAEFRLIEDNAIAVNVFLPDEIFVIEGSHKKLVKFTYEERISLLSQSREFLRLVAHVTMKALLMLISDPSPMYEFKKTKK